VTCSCSTWLIRRKSSQQHVFFSPAVQQNFGGVRYGFQKGFKGGFPARELGIQLSGCLMSCVRVFFSRFSRILLLVSRQRYCSFYDVTCHMTLQHVCVCHSVRVLVLVRAFQLPDPQDPQSFRLRGSMGGVRVHLCPAAGCNCRKAAVCKFMCKVHLISILF